MGVSWKTMEGLRVVTRYGEARSNNNHLSVIDPSAWLKKVIKSVGGLELIVKSYPFGCFEKLLRFAF